MVYEIQMIRSRTLRLWLVWSAMTTMVVVTGNLRGWPRYHKILLVIAGVLGVLNLVLPRLQSRMLRKLQKMSPAERERFMARFDEKTRTLLQSQLSARPTADEWGLEQLRLAGDDLSQPHTLEFQLRFPALTAAERAAERMRAGGFEVEVKPVERNGAWLCVAAKRMVVDAEALRKTRAELAEVAASFDGWCEGWGTAAEKQN